MQGKKKDDIPDNNGVLGGLIAVIRKSLDQVNPLQAFTIAMGALIVLLVLGLAMAPYLSKNLQISSGIIYLALAIIFILTSLVIAVTFNNGGHKKRPFPGEKDMNLEQNQEQYRLLRECMKLLTEPQFREMINYLLKPERQEDLTTPIIKGSFLSDMQRWGKLGEVEIYLRSNFHEFFKELRHE
jgi:hypothetical protein